MLYVVVARLNSYNEYQVGEIAAYVVALVGLSLLTGTNGQISLGHGAFMAVGAYTMALLMNHTQTNFILELAAAVGRSRGGRTRHRPAGHPPQRTLPGGHDAPLRAGSAVHRRQVARHVRRRPGFDNHGPDRAGIIERRGVVGRRYRSSEPCS